MSPSYNVVAKTHPLRPAVVQLSVPAGDPIEVALVDAAQLAGTELRLLHNACVLLNGERIEPERWGEVCPHEGDELTVAAVPNAAAIPLLASVVAHWGAASLIPTAFALAHPLATALIVGGIATVAGTLASQLIAPTPKQVNMGRGETVDARYTIKGIRNEARPYGTIPKVYGKLVNYYPLLATQPYSETLWGDDQYVRMLFDVGHGPLQITDIKIGDKPISQYQDVSYEVRNGYSTDPAITLFPAQVREESLSIQLKYTDGFSAVSTVPDTDEACVDIQFPNGLQRITDRNIRFGITVSFEIQIRLLPGGSWQTPTGLLSSPSGGVVISGGTISISANTKSAVRRSVRIVFPYRAQWGVQVRRTTIDDQGDYTGDNQSVTTEQSYWTAFRSQRNDAPVLNKKVARIAVRCRATDQLNGIIDQLNCTVESILPVWNGSTWSNQVTRNPAWAYCDVLRSEASARPLAASRIDLDEMLAWASWCSAQGFTFDGSFDQRTSIWEALGDIAATACASPTVKDGLFSVVVDNERSTVVQHFTPRNSWGFRATKSFSRRPHALKVRFPNERTRHQMDEIIVYEEGYNAANATVFEALDLPYTTSAQAAWKRARRAMAAARLRPEIYTIMTDIEHLPLTRGDLVRVTHDVPLWGLGSARLKSLMVDGTDTIGVVLDAAVTIEDGKSYGARFRMADGTTWETTIATVPGTSAQLLFGTPVATASGPVVGDLCLFGEQGTESTLCLVRSIEPAQDMTAMVTLVDYAPAVQTSASGDIPDFDPNITIPPVENRASPPIPQVVSVESDEFVLIRNSDGTLTSRIVVKVLLKQSTGNVPAEVIQTRFRDTDYPGDWTWLSSVPAVGSEVSVMPVQDGFSYTIQLRSVSQFGATSDWTEVVHKVVGKTNPPPSVTRFYRSGDKIVWPYDNPPIDLAGFELRANYGTSQDWNTGRRLHAGLVPTSPFDVSDLHGTQTIMIKAVDTSGLYSDEAAALTIDLGDMYVENIVVTQAEGPTWSGTLTGGTDTGTQIEASTYSSPPFWRAEDLSVFWLDDADSFWATTIYQSMQYVARYTPTTDILNDGILKLDLTVTGDYLLDYRIATSTTFWDTDVSTFWAADGVAFWDSDLFTDWEAFAGSIGPFDTTAYSYEFRLTTPEGQTQGICSKFNIVVDVPDIEELFEDVAITVAASGKRLSLTKTYRAIDVVNLTLQDDGGTAAYLKVIDKNATTGPLVKAYTTAGATTTATFDARIKGH